MELIKGAPVSAKIKEEVGAMLEKINGPAPKLAIIRVGENPDDMSYERGAVKKNGCIRTPLPVLYISS